MVKNGEALWVIDYTGSVPVPTWNLTLYGRIKMVPRIDCITKADVERAYVDCSEEDIEYINEYGKLLMDSLAALIAPFRPDPWIGRPRFVNVPDMRTSYGK